MNRSLSTLLGIMLLVLPIGCGAPPVTEPAPKPTAQAALPARSGVINVTRHGYHFLARVHINGENVGFFLVDTGAAVAAIDASVARDLNLASIRRGTLTGIGGRTTVEYVKLDQVEVDGVALGPAIAAVIDMEQLSRGIRWSIKGIVGFNSLGRYPFTIDYKTNTLTLHDPATFQPPTDSHEMRLELRNRLPAVQVRFGDHEPIWLMVDTGANNWLSLPMAYVQPRPDILSGQFNPHATSRGVTGQINDIRSKLKAIDLFGVRLHEVPVTIEMAPVGQPDAATKIGRLGNRLLKDFKLTFDYRHRKLWARFEPEQQ